MKLEIIYKNSCFTEQIDNIPVPEGVAKKVQDIHGLYFVAFETRDETQKGAKDLSSISEIIINYKQDAYISINEAAAFFNLSLYPEFNTFERNLRRLIYIIAIKSNDNEIAKYANKIEGSNFNELMNRLFNNTTPLKNIKKRTNQADFLGQMTEKHINHLPEKSLWSYFVTQESYLAKTYDKIIDYRDSVMHAENMSFKKFIVIKHTIDSANTEVEFLIAQYINCDLYLTTPVQKIINKAIKNLLIGVEI